MCLAYSKFLCAGSNVELICCKTVSLGKLDVYVWLVMLVFVFVKDCDLYGLFTKSVFSYLEAIQLASSRMLDHVRGSTLSDGLILGLEAHQVVCVCICVSVCARLIL